MSRIEIHQTIIEPPIGKRVEMGIDFHWNDKGRMVLIVEDAKVTVIASDLRQAVENATHTE